MLNCGLEKLRVINPKFSLNDEKIIPLSAGASKVIKNIKLYDSVAKSIADIRR